MDLEDTVIKCVEAGFMTKDLALLVGTEQEWLTTEQFLAELETRLKSRLNR